MNGDNPSIHEANKVLRVLSGERLKFTCRVHKPDGTVIEFQSRIRPKLDYSAESRSLWLVESEYQGAPIMEWPVGSMLLCEDNDPKP